MKGEKYEKVFLEYDGFFHGNEFGRNNYECNYATFF
jgi:hypothetical protein